MDRIQEDFILLNNFVSLQHPETNRGTCTGKYAVYRRLRVTKLINNHRAGLECLQPKKVLLAV